MKHAGGSPLRSRSSGDTAASAPNTSTAAATNLAVPYCKVPCDLTIRSTIRNQPPDQSPPILHRDHPVQSLWVARFRRRYRLVFVFERRPHPACAERHVRAERRLGSPCQALSRMTQP